MKRFVFRLQKILGYRADHRDLCKRAVQAIQAEIVKLEQALELQQTQFDSTKDADNVILLAEAFLINAAYRERLKVESEATRIEIVNKNKELSVAMDAYVEASKELRAVELLRERKLQQFNQDLLKAEGETLDELSTLRHNRFQS